MSLFLSRTDRSLLSQWWWTIDRKMLFALLAIVGFGIVMVSAASPAVATRIGLNEYHFIIRHMIFLVPALVAMIGLSFLSKSSLRRIGIMLFGLSLVGVMMALLGGDDIKGAQRWIRLFGFSVQPSEFLKPAFAVVAAWLMARPGCYVHSARRTAYLMR